MEKLIELLDLYRRENKTEELFWEPWTLVPLTWKDFIMLNRVMIISKEYGFIKWLVDNDKIDREKIDWLNLIPTLTYQNMIEDCDCWKSHWHPYTFAWYIDELLMLLAISNEPINDLISYLK